MKNSFTVTVEFSFKGETFEFTQKVDLDSYMVQMNGIPNLHDLIARQHNIDSYSYQYEVLHAEELHFSEVQGIAGEFVHDNEFDADGFAVAWREQRVARVVSEIAARLMGITDLDRQPQLKQALIAAYQAGQEQPATAS
jgi:hypothetical protein